MKVGNPIIKKSSKAFLMKKFLSLLIATLASFIAVNAQNNQITGTVSDSTGDAVIGASVIEKGVPSNGVTTNASGRFTITLRGSSRTLIITNVGYNVQELYVGNNNDVRIVLKSVAGSLADVVVVGYGRQRRITTTGAVSSVSGVELRENPAASIQNTLTGRLPGLFSQQSSGRPGADGANFYIRGVSSYNTGSTTPLIIVDDIEFSYDQFSRLDPNEIESLSILKDASTTAIYGVRGANGVVIVTTRRGKISAPQISFRGEMSLQQPDVMPKFLNAYDAAVLYNQGRTNDNQPLQFTQADLDAFKNHTDPYGHPDINWRDVLFKNFSRQYRGNFDITGGTESVKYFISAGYLFQDGMVKNFASKVGINNNFYHQRYNYRSNLDVRVTRTTDLRLDLFGNVGQTNTPQTGSPFGYNDLFYDYSSIYTLAPWAYPIYNPDGSLGYSQWAKAPGTGGSSYDVNNVIGRLTYLGYTRSFETNMNLVGSANQKLDFITRGLSLKGTLSYASTYSNPNISMSGSEFPSFIYDPATNTYAPRNSNVFRVRRLIRGSSNGSTVRTLQTQLFLNYDRNFNSVHHVYGLIMSMQNSVTQSSGTSAFNFIPNNLRGYLARVGYDYHQKYLFEFNAAYNGSDRFSKAHRYGFFPAGSIGWNISEEDFFRKNVHFINRMKIRGSYGLVGNDKIGANFSYYYQLIYNTAGNQVFFGNPNANAGGAVYEGTLGNPDVSWEKEKKLDIGLELGMFKNKFTSTIDYFYNKRFDILTDRSGRIDSRFGSVSAAFGQTLPPVNIGKVDNKGIEVDMNYNGNIGNKISFSVKGTYSYAKNKIVFADEPTYQYPYMAYTGQSINTQRVYTWIGFYRDSSDIAKSAKPAGITVRPGDLKYADLNGDGIINGFDAMVQGNPNIPNTTGGLQLQVRYKGFNIGVFFQGSWNFNVRGLAEAIQPFGANFTKVHQLAWTPQIGDNAKFPLLSFIPGISDSRAYPSTFWLIPGDYVRLKTAEIGYALPDRWVRSLRMKSIRIYSNGYNLITWTKLSKLYQMDPEINQGNNGVGGTDRVNYPPQRIINFGVSATF
jgi:TonB-linked SusC/RagA family outer membrane protein